MKNLSKKIWLCLLLIACANGYASAQQKQQKACPVPPPSPYKHTAYIATRFDAAADSMRTVLEHPVTLGDKAQPLYLFASFAYPNAARQTDKTRTVVNLALISVAPLARFNDAHDLRIYVDGREQVRLAPGQYRAETDDANQSIEWTQITLSAQSLRELTKAAHVEIALNGDRHKLTNNHLEALRELVSLMRPPGFAAAAQNDLYDSGQSGY
jgi:hypothetical protein